MKLIGITSAAALFLLLGVSSSAYARQEEPKKQEEKAKPAKQEQQVKPEKQQAKPEKQQQARAPKQEQQAKPEKQQQARAPKQEQQAKPEKQQQARAPKQEHQAPQERQQQASSQRPQRTQQEESRQRSQPALRLSVRGGGRIPDERFHSNFGREHHFRIGEPVLVGGYSRFQYSGFWFGFVEPWPEGWYYTDDVYIDYVDGGYYMYDPYYPGARFAISVVI